MTNSRYCPVHNPFGTFKDINGKNWYESSYPINSVFDAHQNVGTALARPDSKNKGIVYKNDFIELHTTTAEDTLFEAEKRRSAYYAGFGGVSGLVSTVGFSTMAEDHTDSSYFAVSSETPLLLNTVYKIVVTELGKTITYENVTLSNFTNGKYYGSDKINESVTTSVGDSIAIYKTLPILSNENSFVTDIIGDTSQYNSTDTTSALQTTSTDTGTELRQNALVWNVEENRIYIFKSTATDDGVDLTPGADAPQDFTDDSRWGYVQKGYPQSFLDRLSEGKPLIGMYSSLVNKNDGSSMIPDGTTSMTFQYSEKLKQGLSAIVTVDSKNFNTGTLPSSNITNTYVTYTPGLTELRMFNYTKANNPMQVSTPKPITYVSPKVVNSSSHSIYQAGLITNSITGGIATADELVKFESKVLENCEINKGRYLASSPSSVPFYMNITTCFYNKKTDLNGVYGHTYRRLYSDNTSLIPNTIGFLNTVVWEDIGTEWNELVLPQHSTPTLTSSTSKASKSFYTKAIDGSKHYDMIFGQGLIEDSGYNSTKFTNLTNGTTVDDAGHTVNTKVLARQNQYKR